MSNGCPSITVEAQSGKNIPQPEKRGFYTKKYDGAPYIWWGREPNKGWDWLTVGDKDKEGYRLLAMAKNWGGCRYGFWNNNMVLSAVRHGLRLDDHISYCNNEFFNEFKEDYHYLVNTGAYRDQVVPINEKNNLNRCLQILRKYGEQDYEIFIVETPRVIDGSTGQCFKNFTLVKTPNGTLEQLCGLPSTIIPQ